MVCLENGSQAETQHEQGMEECKGRSFLRAARLSVARTKSWVEQVGMEVSERALHLFVGNKLTCVEQCAEHLLVN